MVTDNHVRLTANRQSQQGAIWNKVVSFLTRACFGIILASLKHSLQPVNSRNWELMVQFRVSGTTKDLFGDGFAIWYTRDRMRGGEVFGNQDYFSGLAIIADTYSNHNGPHNVSNYLLNGLHSFFIVCKYVIETESPENLNCVG